jgi:hypothetical protein
MLVEYLTTVFQLHFDLMRPGAGVDVVVVVAVYSQYHT